ncbi:MAG TPA: metallophosphoesterase [Clostridiales bacterium]|nr:metallophosphoesterase [Clostridiales bacterium]
MAFLIETPFLLIGLIVFLFLVFEAFQNNWIQVSRYQIESKKVPLGFDGYRICQLSDLHSKRFGKNHERLMRKIDQIKPDLIAITGDVMNNKGDDGAVFLDLLSKLTKYPCFYIIGNHEQFTTLWDEGFLPEYLNKIRKAGAVVLNNEKTVIKKGLDHINLYGMHIDLQYYRNMTKPKFRNVVFTKNHVKSTIGDSHQKEFNLLLTHNPLFFGAYADWGADLVLSGHVHGGVIRIPSVGGLLSPERVFFPKYSEGVYTEGKSKMVVSRGLGNSTVNLRVFNRPEIVDIEIKHSV